MRALLGVVNAGVLAVAVLALPYVRADAVVPPEVETPATAVAHLEAVWERASREPGPSQLVRQGGVRAFDGCIIGFFTDGPDVVDDGQRSLTWTSPPGADGPRLLRQVREALLASGHEQASYDPAELRGDGGYRWRLRLEGGRAVVTGETSCLEVVLPARFARVGSAEDRQSLREALRDEDTLDRPVRVTHYLGFDDGQDDGRRRTAREAAAAGWEVVLGDSEDTGLFSASEPVVLARRTVLLTPASVPADTAFFTDLCRRSRCTYGGWTTRDYALE